MTPEGSGMAKIAPRHVSGDGVVRLRMTLEALTYLTRVAGAMCALLRAGEVPAETSHSGPDASRQAPKGLLSALEAAVEQAQRVIGKQPDASPGSANGRGRKRWRTDGAGPVARSSERTRRTSR
ncbi:hypothetical protein M2167_001010 [Streptomyces sp. SPB4]|nr:hypothetical protein [Streptomyces sp. SPB4]